MILKKFFSDTYDGIYLRQKKLEHRVDKQHVLAIYFFTFLMYYLALLMLIGSFRSILYGPTRISFLPMFFILIGGYGVIFYYFIYPYRTIKILDENMDESTLREKRLISIVAQVGGLMAVLIAALVIYFLYEIFEPTSKGGLLNQ